VSGVTAFDLLPDIAATTNFITPEGVAPEGLIPEGLIPEGLIPEVLIPKGLIPEGVTPERVRARRPSPDPDAPVINIFDEERLCEETATSSQPRRERCQ